jgi:hypothetical protein
MPFTLAHPAGALPFKWIKRGLFSTTGLVAGSMAPDYEYFLKQQPSPTLSETFWGSLLFNLPLAIIVALVFHLLVKRPLLRHLPHPYDQRYSGYVNFSFLNYLGRHWHLFLLSVLLGIGSHHLLDWMTHPIQGPFNKTFLTKIITAGPVRDRPLVFLERLFEVTVLFTFGLLLLKVNRPAPHFIPAKKTLKWIFWLTLLSISVLLILWEWYESGGIDRFSKGITTVLWAVSVSLVTSSVLILLIRRIWYQK